MTALRQAVAAKRHDPDCGAELRPEAFTHIPNPVDPRRVPALLTGTDLLLDQRFKADAHAYAEWLLAECDGKNALDHRHAAWITEVPHRIPERLEAAEVCHVVHLMRTSRDPLAILACCAQLERRWAASPNGQALRESLADPRQQDGGAA